MIGTIINSITIVFASLIGIFIGDRLNDRIRLALMQALGLVVAIIGIDMALKTQNILIVIASVLLGTAIGEVLGIEDWLNRVGSRLERKFSKSKFAEGFVTSTLLFCVGSMAIVGPIQEGLTGDTSILMAKSMLDGISSIALSSTLGIGVLFSSIAVFIYQGSITILSRFIEPFVNQTIVDELTATGGVLIMAIAIKLLNLKDLRAGNMLPALFVAQVITYFFNFTVNFKFMECKLKLAPLSRLGEKT